MVVEAIRADRAVTVRLPVEREQVLDEATIGRVKVGVRTDHVVTARVVMIDAVTIDGPIVRDVMIDVLRVGVPMVSVAPMVVVLMIVGLMIVVKVVVARTVVDAKVVGRMPVDPMIVKGIVVGIVVGIAARRDSSSARSELRRTKPSVAARQCGRVAREKFVRVSSKPRSNVSPSVGSTRARSERRQLPPLNEPNRLVLVEPKTSLSTPKSRKRSRPHSSRVARRDSVIVCSKPRSRSKVNGSPTLVVWPTRCSRKCPMCQPCTR